MQNKKSQREKTPQNHSAQPKGQDDNKVHYPLLSGCDLKRGIGIVSETAGVFTPLANGIRDLSNVTQYMSGTTDNRESIPSAHSQTIAFEITLTAYPNKPESRTVVEQWRGALCTALLYPVLFTSKDMLVWRKGILPDDNLFVDLLKRCRGSYALELDALCVQKKGRTYPILYCSEQCGVVPAAYGIESDLCRLPWLKPRKTAADISPDSIQLLFFTDPLPYLSLGQLRLLLRGLQSVAELRPFGASVALDEFINDVKDSILSHTHSNPYEDLEANLLCGLMLRNTQDWGLHIVQRQAVSISENLKPPICHITLSLCRENNLIVLLEQQIVAYLDDAALLCSVNPDRILKLPAYQQLAASLKFCSEGAHDQDWLRLMNYQRSRLEDLFPESSCLRTLKKRYCEPVDYQMLQFAWNPVCANSDEADLSSDRRYAPLKAVALVRDNVRKLFSEELLYIKHDQSIYDIGSVKPLHEIRISGERYFFVFTPAGVFGGKVLAKCETAKLTCAYDDKHGGLAFLATFTVSDDDIVYIATKTFDEAHMHAFDANKLPCVALWPDVLDTVQPGEPFWKLYYLFICFRYASDSLEYTTEVYDVDGNQVPVDNQIMSKDSKENLNQWWHQWWRNYSIGAVPGFIQFFHNGQSVGLMMLRGNKNQSTYRLHKTQQKMTLAIDFGTTSSIVAVRQGNGNDCCIPALDDNHLTWLMNKQDGNLLASRYFISNAFCRNNGDQSNGAILTAIRRFDSAIESGHRRSDNVHIDGNIHFMADNFKREDQDLEIRSGFKIMLHYDEYITKDDAGQLTLDTKLFIKQLLHMYFLYCRKQDANHVDVYFATPLALSNDERAKLIDVFRNTTREIADEVGFDFDQDVNVLITTESKAVGAYFQHEQNIMNLSGRGIFTLDIGGGTSDYSFWMQDQGQISSFVCCSNRMAGHEMLARFLYNELKSGTSIEYLWNALEAQSARSDTNDKYYASLCKQLKAITATTEQAAKKIEWIMDQLLILYYSEFANAFRDQACARLLSAINFQLALLFWVGQVVYEMVKTRLNAKNQGKGVTICLAGNGANFYRLIPENRKLALSKVFKSTGLNLEIRQHHNQRDQKTEVAKGLLLDPSIFEMNDEEDDMPQRIPDPEAIWNSLLTFLKTYADIFQEQFDDSIAVVIRRLFQSNERLKDIQESFLASVHRLDQLNQYIVRLKDQVLFESVFPVSAFSDEDVSQPQTSQQP